MTKVGTKCFPTNQTKGRRSEFVVPRLVSAGRDRDWHWLLCSSLSVEFTLLYRHDDREGVKRTWKPRGEGACRCIYLPLPSVVPGTLSFLLFSSLRAHGGRYKLQTPPSDGAAGYIARESSSSSPTSRRHVWRYRCHFYLLLRLLVRDTRRYANRGRKRSGPEEGWVAARGSGSRSLTIKVL